jgi:hypothetical protein
VTARRLRWPGQVAGFGEKRNLHNILVENEDTFKMSLGVMDCENRRRIQLVSGSCPVAGLGVSGVVHKISATNS